MLERVIEKAFCNLDILLTVLHDLVDRAFLPPRNGLQAMTTFLGFYGRLSD